MAFHPHPVPAVPEETARVAPAAFPRDHVSLRRRDAFGALVAAHECAALVPTRGQPAEAPWRLAMVTILPEVEDCSDRRAADAIRGRIDGQYARSVERTDPGLESPVRSELRLR